MTAEHYLWGPPDIEDELRKWWAELGMTSAAYAGSTPSDLDGESVTFVDTGGGVIAPSIYRGTVAIDFRAATEQGAKNLARRGVSALEELEHTQAAGDMTVTRVTVATLPRLNPDPKHPTLHRATVLAELIVRSVPLTDL